VYLSNLCVMRVLSLDEGIFNVLVFLCGISHGKVSSTAEIPV